MEYKISDKMASMKPSAIREILKATTGSSVIPFAAGNPSAEAFPIKEIENIVHIIFSNRAVAALQYSVSEGDPHLRDAVRTFAQSREPGLTTEDDRVLIVSGAQQGIDLAAKCLLNEGDTVLVEDPTFIGALNTLRSYNANLKSIPMEEDGVNLESLENLLKTEKNVRMLYLIPNFQNPSGLTLSAEKRRAVYELARRYQVVILEDNPYGDLRYEGEHIPAIKTLDTEGLVVYLGSFSKIISPGLRVGYVIANAALMDRLVVAKQCTDVHTSILSQMICDRFVNDYDIDGHIANIRKIYAHKCGLMLSQMDEHFHPSVQYTRPEGGLFIWCTLPEGANMMEFCRKAVERKVAVVPGNAFNARETDPSNSFRLNFSTPTDQQMIDGIRILGELTHQIL